MLSKSLAVFGFFAAYAKLCLAADQMSSARPNIIEAITGVSPSDYEVTVESISLTDVDTGISDIKAIHNGRAFDVKANLHWEEEIFDLDSSNTLFWEMSVGGEVQDIGAINLNAVSSITYYSYPRLASILPLIMLLLNNFLSFLSLVSLCSEPCSSYTD